MREFLLAPWPWWLAGPLIGLTVPLLLLVGGRSLGVSSSFRHLCAALLPRTRLAYLRDYRWRDHAWNLLFVAGLALGAFVAARLLSSEPLALLPPHVKTPAGALQLFAGGLLIGFGTRWAAGCTSGHSIMGLSNLQKSGLAATLAFFAGGLAAALVHRLLGLGGGHG